MLSTLKTGLSIRGLGAVRASTVAVRSLSNQATLPEEMSPEDRLVYGEPIQIPTTHNITVAHLHLRSYLPNQLDFFADFARRTAAQLGMPCSGVIPLPVQTSKWTVNKSPFVYKKAQETFERKTHKRLLAIKDTHPEVVRRWVQFLNQNSLAGVGMRVTLWENAELGVGQKQLESVKKGESRNRSVAEMMKSTSDSEPSEEVKEVAEKILAEMMKDIGGEEEIGNAATDFAQEDSLGQEQSPKEEESIPEPKDASPEPTLEDPNQPTESNISEAVEPLTSGSATLDPELSDAVEKAVAESATKPSKE
ncbi:mitochondrial 37S ribosomal protein rsm10 [Lunasporangiospora selenospora]|uniref:Small ribosomal subunit protein uS10m n=1 Tax=Lunasporangiospora selenospora TaxID=979761 RepID=A0A9P6KIL0_9FUNG|nr:mitochondrial 37S ribosomal protein rsm10 [Lunasporangiospora selenospora]